MPRGDRAAFILAGVLLSVSARPSGVEACSIERPDPWWSVRIDIEDASLPSGIAVEVRYTPQPGLQVSNSTHHGLRIGVPPLDAGPGQTREIPADALWTRYSGAMDVRLERRRRSRSSGCSRGASETGR